MNWLWLKNDGFRVSGSIFTRHLSDFRHYSHNKFIIPSPTSTPLARSLSDSCMHLRVAKFRHHTVCILEVPFPRDGFTQDQRRHLYRVRWSPDDDPGDSRPISCVRLHRPWYADPAPKPHFRDHGEGSRVAVVIPAFSPLGRCRFYIYRVVVACSVVHMTQSSSIACRKVSVAQGLSWYVISRVYPSFVDIVNDVQSIRFDLRLDS